MVIEGLGLYYTMRCNASCAHCGVWSSPDRQERMDVEQARRYIRQLSESVHPKVVVFVGGEPLLHLDDICELVAYVRSLGMAAQVSTNAFWASTEKRAQATTAKLAAAGLDHLALSADAYHSEFIDPRNVGRAFDAAREHGFVRKLQVIRSQKSDEGDELVAACGLDPGELLDHADYKRRRNDADFDPRRWIVLNRHWVAPFGRAAFLQGHVALRALADLEDVPCFMARRFPIVYPNGDVYACCCTAGFYKEYFVGNLEQQGLDALDGQLSDDVVFEAISRVGPVALAKAMARQGVDLGDGFANPCHACRETLGRADRESLEAAARSLVWMDELFGDEERRTAFESLV